jgi:hypothetical protein
VPIPLTCPQTANDGRDIPPIACFHTRKHFLDLRPLRLIASRRIRNRRNQGAVLLVDVVAVARELGERLALAAAVGRGLLRLPLQLGKLRQDVERIPG